MERSIHERLASLENTAGRSQVGYTTDLSARLNILETAYTSLTAKYNALVMDLKNETQYRINAGDKESETRINQYNEITGKIKDETNTRITHDNVIIAKISETNDSVKALETKVSHIKPGK